MRISKGITLDAFRRSAHSTVCPFPLADWGAAGLCTKTSSGTTRVSMALRTWESAAATGEPIPPQRREALHFISTPLQDARCLTNYSMPTFNIFQRKKVLGRADMQ